MGGEESRKKEFFKDMLASQGGRNTEKLTPEYVDWLLETEEHMRAFMLNAHEFMIYRLVRDDSSPFGLRVVFVSPSATEILGLEDPERLEDWFAIAHPEDVERIVNSTWNAFDSLRFYERGRIFHRRRDEWRWIQVIGKGSLDLDGMPKHANGVIFDVTEQQEAEEALREREERLSLAMEASNAGVFELHFENRTLHPDDRLIRMFGGEPGGGSYETSALLEYVHPDDRPLAVAAFQDLLTRRTPSYDLELRIRRKSGEFIWVHSRGKVVQWGKAGQPERLVAVVFNVTEKKELAERLRQAQKMEAVGTLAGGIAHDFNNILWPILGFAEMALQEVPDDSEAAENLGKIITAAHRARHLVRQILTVGRKAEDKPLPTMLQPVIRDVLELVRASIPKTVEITTSISEDCGVVLADPTRVHQAVFNLSANAYQALGDNGGTLEILLEEVETGEDSQKQAVITVRDNGPGMAPDVAERIFEPYFTTKEPGKGTGMGLALTHAVVTGLGGDIQVESEPGRGSEFKISFPVVGEAMPEAEKTEGEIPGGHGRILLVEDEEIVRDMTRKMMEKLGYQVQAAPDGRAALRLFTRDPEAFDLVVTDLTMPEMTGRGLARRIKEKRPGLPILLMTGFMESPEGILQEDSPVDALLKKPIRMRVLAESLRRLLDGRTLQ